MEASQYEKEYQFAIAVAMAAGAQIAQASKERMQGGGGKTSDKKNSVDLVTETDQSVEKLVIGELHKTFPEHKFIGEESYADGKKPELTSAPTWICDPIDGTTNYVHFFPYACISIGFCVSKEPIIGVVFNPFSNQLYSASKGNGAYLNRSTRLPLSHPSPLPLASLSEALVAVEWGSDRSKEVLEKKGRTFQKLVGDPKEVEGGKMVHSLRSMGSAALNYCHVAAGALDMYWEIGCNSWDVCAGVIIAREAGGRCYGRGGKLFDADGSGRDLMGHHFFVIRGVAAGKGEESEEVQDRITKEFFETVEEWDV